MYQKLLESLGDQYRPERTLKESKNGKIMLLRDPGTGQRMIYRTFSGSSEAYRKMQTLSCDYLPRVFAVQETDGTVAVLEEYIGGDSLSMVLAGGTLTQEQTRKIGLQLCSALQTLHSAGIVHRDLKPENVLLQQERAVLIDFDASRMIKPRSTTDTRVMGTTGYAAPEQYGFSQTDARADIYAFGILLNEMLTGQHPSKHLAEGSLRPVIEKCIEVNMDKRYHNVRELRKALEPAQVKKKRTLSIAAAAVLAAAAFVGGFLLAPRESDKAVEVMQHDPMVVTGDKKLGITVPYSTLFLYDLDGDGQKEEYQFGILIDTLESLPFIVRTDTIAPGDESDLIKHRIVYPAVWRARENGELELVPEFADLLENAEICLWRLTNLDSEAPAVLTTDGDWKGGLTVEYHYAEHLGSWLYEARATLEGAELSAQSITAILAEDPGD